jgi:hypothetical protein
MSYTGDIEVGLKALVAQLTGLETVWENEPRPQVTAPGIALLSTFALRSIGEDVLSYVRVTDLEGWGAGWMVDPWPGVSAPLLESVHGPREVTLRVRVETYDHTPGSTARTFLERLRTRLRFTSSGAALRALNLGLQGRSPSKTFPPHTTIAYTVQERWTCA